jgi:cytochrome P450
VLPEYLPELTERYGDIVAFRLPSKRFVLLNHPEQIKDLLVTQQHAFRKSIGARTLRILLGEGLLTSDEPYHRQMRRVVQPAFHHERIAAYARTMRTFAREWSESVVHDEPIEMHGAMSELALRIASETLFGADSSRESAEVRAALHATLEAYPLAIGPIGALRQRIPFLPSTRAFAHARERLDRIIYGIIAARRAHPQERSDALSMLLQEPLSDEQVRDEALTLFLAGHETTANALTWTWYLLAQHPDAADKIRADENGEYTRRVLRESMRLYPPAWIIGREAAHDVTLAGGYRIARGTTVFVCPLVLHRRAAFYREPQRFDPDRWLDENVPQFAYVPFGGGARRCIGEEFAWTEAAIVLGEVARRWRFDLLSSQPPGLRALVTLRPRDPSAGTELVN